MKRVLITGAGSGIGAGLAAHLANPERIVTVTDRDESAAGEVGEKLRSAGHAADVLKLDVANDADLESLRAWARRHPVDILINNAGLQHVAPLEDFAPERFRRLVDVLLTGSALCAQATLPGMREAGWGRIINIGSVHSIVASPFKSAYVAAKHGLLGLSKVLALETADVDVTVNTVCPGYVDTPLVRSQIADQAQHHGLSPSEVVDEVMLKSMPKKAWISIAELTAAVEYFISPLAQNVTGQTLVLDGGWTAR